MEGGERDEDGRGALRLPHVSQICMCHKSTYPKGYTSKNSRPPRSIGSFSPLRYGLKLLPAAYEAHVHLKQVGITCISS
jgi:hypothetical protein